MERGKVKWFNDKKGYGFILSDKDGADVLVHHSVIRMEGFRFLREGQQVTFDAQENTQGRAAVVVFPA